MRVGLISTYELGHQPLHVASPAAALRAAGHEVRALDLSVEFWDPEFVAWADAVAASVPMHTAMRLAVSAAERVRAERPELPIAFYGLYAPVSREHVVGNVADRVIAGEYEPALVSWVGELEEAGASPTAPGTDTGTGATLINLGRSQFHVPARDLLPGLDKYARVVVEGEERLAGYTEATHGCAHECRHCPIPAVYGGRTRLIDRDVVLADIEQQVAAGARHITFGDPDFLNGWRHALKVVHALHERFPDVTYDVTVKVEHILRDEAIWKEFADTGCLFVVSAVECVNDRILQLLDKGHDAADVFHAVEVLRTAGIEMRPSLLPFTPWSSVADVADIFDFVTDHDLVANVDPVQYSIRLLLPTGSLLLDLPEMQPHLGSYDEQKLTWAWEPADPAVDALQQRLAVIAEDAAASEEPAEQTFVRMRTAVLEAAGHADPPGAASEGVPQQLPQRPGLTEPWFCCAEPTEGQFGVLA